MAKTSGNTRRRTSSAPRRRRQGSTVPTTLAVILLVVALLAGGLAGFAVARSTDSSRKELQAARERNIELENILTMIGFDVEQDNASEWVYNDALASDALDELSDDFSGDVSDLWNDDGLLSGMLPEDGEPVVVAEYDGGQLLSTEVVPVFNEELTTQIFAGYDPEEISSSLLQAVMSMMVSDKLMSERAKAMGLDQLTDEDLTRIDAEAQEEYEESLEYYSAFIAEDGMSAEEIRAAAVSYMESEAGITVDAIVEEKKSSWWAQKLYDEMVKDITVTDEEVQVHYSEILADQKASFDASPEEFEYSHINGDALVYRPAGYRAVRDILIGFDSDEQMALASDLMDQLATMDPAEDGEALESVSAQLDALFAPLESRAGEVIAKLDEGADFAELMDEYGCDEFLKEEPLRSEGYYISANSFLNSTEYVEGSMMLEQPGQVSTPLRSPFGVHVVQYIGDITPGEVPLSEVEDAMRAETLEIKQDEYYESQRTAILDAAHVKYYPERLQ